MTTEPVDAAEAVHDAAAPILVDAGIPKDFATTPHDLAVAPQPDLTTPPSDLVGLKGVFVTRSEYAPNFGALTIADAYCTADAHAAQLGGTWKAWISNSTMSAIDRITDVGPWYLIGSGAKVFANKSDLALYPLVAIDHDEHGMPLSSTDDSTVWTGTGFTGVGTGLNCSDWSTNAGAMEPAHEGQIGWTISTTASWTNESDGLCGGLARLYCLQQ